MSSALSNDEISQGFKEALDVGVKKAIDMLGTENGFLNDQSVKIPLPDSMQQLEKALRSFGQEKMADEFVTSMNRAAEQVVPQVSNVFVDAIVKCHWMMLRVFYSVATPQLRIISKKYF